MLRLFGALLAGLFVCASAAMAAAQTYNIGPLKIEVPWTRATPGGAKVAGGYMTITNTGTESDRLIGGTFPLAGRFEVHEMKMVNGVMEMREIDGGLEIPPGQKVELRPGGYHVMFMDLREPLKQGEKLKGQLRFQKAGTLDIEYRVEAIGVQSPARHGH